MTTKRNLLETLAQVKKPTAMWTSSDGSAALVLPYGGRILGLFAPGSERNFFWTHPALDAADSAKELFQSAGWHNSGGDRTWLSPELDFFFPRFPDLGVYWQPRELDPGHYQLTTDGDGLVLENRLSCELSRSKRTVDLQITKRLTSARSPLRHHAIAGSLLYAGYTLQARLAFATDNREAAQVSLWSLLQMPHGGELVIPTLSKAVIKTYFGDINARDLHVTGRLVRYQMRAAGLHKFGIEPPAATGRAGYLYADGSECCLVIRNFHIDPSGEYLDVPCQKPNAAGSVVEACNVNDDLGQFSELEYHSPAIGGTGNKSVCEDESQVWAYRGKKEDILEAARILLSCGL